MRALAAHVALKRREARERNDLIVTRPWQAWRRPTLPRLKTQYHRRWSFSRPSSGWDRVFTLRQNHQASKGRCQNLVFTKAHIEMGADNESNQAYRAISTG